MDENLPYFYNFTSKFPVREYQTFRYCPSRGLSECDDNVCSAGYQCIANATKATPTDGVTGKWRSKQLIGNLRLFGVDIVLSKMPEWYVLHEVDLAFVYFHELPFFVQISYITSSIINLSKK